ncbi:MAG TPA: hypothetical protein VMN35_07810 [Gaiellaceae bacterium]|nr:hypothetical protein [Gaiellaceae bacterium]
MPAVRFATLLFALLVGLLVVSAPGVQAGPSAPTGLRGFLLRPGESVTHTFSRTPAFAWNPVRGASCYEFQLATSRTFEDSTVVWSNVISGKSSGRACKSARKITIPAASIDLTLPWFTGRPYALYGQVRAITPRGPSGWSRPFGFNMRWEDLPVPMASRPGLVRWRPVEGATAYEVWYPEIERRLQTHTNVADLREFYSFHDNANWWATVRWRVRAVRQILGSIPNGLPAVSYGPWSPSYATTNPDLTLGKVRLGSTLSDVVASSWKSGAHQLMPGVTFSGLDPFGRDYLPLYRAYAFTDRDCVNVVFRGSVVGSPAFAPRLSGPLKLPTTWDEIEALQYGTVETAASETAKTFTADRSPVSASETLLDDGAAPPVDLPDVDARTTRYFWTVVPVGIRGLDSLEYVDLEVPQDACAAGRVATFAKRSRPAVTASGTPYVSGLTPKGRLLASASRQPTVYSTPLVAWKPVIGATGYEIQWSRSKYPWRVAGTKRTVSTSTVLGIGPGLWYYRVRGLNGAQVGTPVMTWSQSVGVRVVRPTFRINGR